MLRRNQLVNWSYKSSISTLYFRDTTVSMHLDKDTFPVFFQRPRGTSFPNARTTSPFFKSLTVSVHLGLTLSVSKYSVCYLDQTREIRPCTFRHRFLGLNGCTPTFSGTNCTPICPCRKWFGVNGTSCCGCAQAVISSLSVTSVFPALHITPFSLPLPFPFANASCSSRNASFLGVSDLFHG